MISEGFSNTTLYYIEGYIHLDYTHEVTTSDVSFLFSRAGFSSSVDVMLTMILILVAATTDDDAG